MLCTRFTDRYGITAPVALAGMAFIAHPRLAAAIANAGGFGMLGIGAGPPEAVHQMVRATRALTGRPFGASFIIETTPRGPLTTEAHLDACLGERLPVASFFWTLPPAEWIAKLHQGGCHVWFQTGSVADAVAAVARGVDLIIAQGSEAGGHNRSDTGLVTLLPRIVDAVGRSVPVLAAGGVADGRGLAAALCLGADGAWVGTRFVATIESNAHADYKQRIVGACERDIVRTRLFGPEWPDAPIRVIRNRVVAEWSDGDQAAARSAPTQAIGETCLAGQRYAMPKFSAILPTPETSGDFEEMCLPAGKSAALVDDIPTAASVLRRIVGDAEHILCASRNG